MGCVCCVGAAIPRRVGAGLLATTLSRAVKSSLSSSSLGKRCLQYGKATYEARQGVGECTRTLRRFALVP